MTDMTPVNQQKPWRQLK